MTTQDNICSAIEPAYIPGTGIQIQLLNLRHIKAHHHENGLEILYCLKGHVWGHIAHDVLEMTSGLVVTFDRDDVHNIFADKDNLCLIVHIDLNHPDYDHSQLYNTLYSCTNHPSFLRYPDQVETVCDMLLAAAYVNASDSETRTEKCERIHRELIDMMLRYFEWFSLEDSPAKGIDKYDDRFHQILEHVMNLHHEKITLAKLSETLYLNPSYISSFISRTTFSSLTEIVNYFRCFHAEKLLLETDLTVGDISSMVGFSSEKYFYKWFKYWWHTTPLQHRKQFYRYANRKEEYYEYSPSEAKSILKDYIVDRLVDKFI